jgi:ECF transporter S component (folate family)
VKTVVRTRTLAYLGLLTATSVVLTRFFAVMLPIGGVGALRLSFGEVPIILSGILFGPVAGGAVGTLADLIGFPINPFGGAYFPPLTLTSALHGILPPLIIRMYARVPYRWRDLGATVLLNDLVVAVVLQTLFLSILLDRAVLVLLPLRLLGRLLLVPVYTTALYLAVTSYYALDRHRAVLGLSGPRGPGTSG